MFDVLLSLVKDIGVEGLDLQFENLAAFVGPDVTNFIDRSFNTKLQHEAHAVELHERSLVKNVAGLRLSVDLHEDDVEEDNDEEQMFADRRERLMKNIKTAGLEN